MSMLFTQLVVVVRAGELVDRYGNTKPDWGAGATRTPVSGVNVQPAASPSSTDEHVDDRQTTVTKWRLYTPRRMDLDLRETDRVEFDGMSLEVDGKVGRWTGPGGSVHHIEATLKEID
jgi:hypothetical protein